MNAPPKAAVVEALIRHLEQELAGVEAMAKLATDEATSAETKSEGKYDTRSTEASYLARGQAERVASLANALSQAKALAATDAPAGSRAGVGRLITLEDEDERELAVFLVPSGGGTTLIVEQCTIRVVTPASPMGRALMGAEEDDEVEVQAGGRLQRWVLQTIR